MTYLTFSVNEDFLCKTQVITPIIGYDLLTRVALAQALRNRASKPFLLGPVAQVIGYLNFTPASFSTALGLALDAPHSLGTLCVCASQNVNAQDKSFCFVPNVPSMYMASRFALSKASSISAVCKYKYVCTSSLN